MTELKKLISKYGEWNFFPYQQKYMGFKVYCKPFFDFLVENDFHIKSKIPPIKILSKIPKENLHYFFRGFFDGDGSFALNHKRKSVLFSVTGPYNYDWSFVTKLFEDLGIKFTIRNIKKINSSFSEVRINRLEDTTKLSNFIYNNGNWGYIGLERKFTRAFINKLRTV
jgi:intein-encoded DNA endonuclease-like protein